MSRIHLYLSLLPVFLACGSSVGGSEPLDVIRDSQQRYLLFEPGKSHFQIVLPMQPELEETQAAQLLRETLQAMGCPASGETGPIRIHVGRTEFAVQGDYLPPELDADGFVIRAAGPNDLVLLGGRSVSTFYAVTEFLERYAGVLWVWPGRYGTVIPKTPVLDVTVREQVSEPAFRARRFSGIGDAQPRLFRIHHTARERRSEFHHNVWKVLTPEIAVKHPEYLAEVNGARLKVPEDRPNMGWQACTSNPEVVRLFADAARKQFDEFPWVLSFSVSQNDGSGFCQCANCRALDVPGEAGISDRYFTFLNAVADKVAGDYPDKLISCFAYGAATRDVPRRVTLRPNTMIYAVVPTLNDVHEDIRQWSQVAPNLGAYFWLHGKAVPKFYPHRFAEYLRFLHANRVREVYAEVYQNNAENLASWELDGPRVWITAKLLWNPEADVDELLERFCSRFYGDAAKPMLRYYRQCEIAWERREEPSDFGREYRSHELGLYISEDVDVMEACLAEARQLAQGEAEQKRVELLQEKFLAAAAWIRRNDLGRMISRQPVHDVATADHALEAVLQGETRSAAAADDPPAVRDVSLSNEAAIDAKFSEITRLLGERASDYWAERLTRYAPIARFIGTQQRLLEDDLPNLAVNGGFEQSGGGDTLGEPDRDDFDSPGWARWLRPATPGTVCNDTGTARGGDRSVLLYGCVAACVNHRFRVVPDQRYRVSVWAKSTPVADGKSAGSKPAASLVVKWMDAVGKWMPETPTLSTDLTRGTTDWTRLDVVTTIPPDVGQMVVMLSVNNQWPAEQVWFDDVTIEKLYDANGHP